ncbi:MAG: DUF4962 domain-containing protein [Pirellulales bacterium]|nr:DUF4962 domain-containing protein [Pirellulales bacterium]
MTAFLLAATVLSVSCARMTDAQSAGNKPPEDSKRIRRHLEHTPDWNEKPFAPADGSTIEVNPPAFVWLPVKQYTGGYVFALSRSDDFSSQSASELDSTGHRADAPQTTVIETPISVHVPTEPLPTGRWYWRAGVRLSNGKIIWGKTRQFVVPDTARAWPFPKIDELVAKIPKSHPRLLFPGKCLEEVRAKRHTTLRREYAKLIEAAESAIGKQLVTEPQFLKKQDTERGEEYAEIFRATRPPMDLMETCGLAYLLTGERRFGEEAKRRILHFFAWNPEGSTNLFHNDEPAMWMMQRGVRAYDWCYDLFTPDERKKVESVMKVRCHQFRERLRLMPFESRPYSSHPARDLGFLGEAALCFAHEWPEARDWLSYVMKVYWSVFPAWGQDDGGWQEGPSYWRAYMGFTLHFTTALEKATGEQISRRPFFQNTPYFGLYTNPPYAQMSPFGDAQQNPPGRGMGRLMYCFSTLLWDPYVRWYADAVRSGPGLMPISFALCDCELRAKPPVDLPQARVFPGAGLIAMHDDLADTEENAYLVMRSSPFGSVSHGHSDQNAFAIEARGQALAIASGYYPWYGSPHHHDWTRSTKAKNCITIDGGQGQIRRSAKSRGCIDRFVTDCHFDYARGDATEAYGDRLKQAIRHAIHIRPGTFVIIDELAAPKPTSFEWNLHALEKMSIDADKQLVRIHRDKSALLANFVEPAGLSFTQTDQFTPPPEYGGANQWHLTATTPKNPASVFFVVMQTHTVDQTPTTIQRISQDGCKGVTWKDGEVEYTILYGPEGIETRRIQSDARIVATRTHVADQKPQIDWLAVDATRLSIDDHRKLLVEPAVTIADEKAKSKECSLTAVCSNDKRGASLTTDGPAVVAQVAVAREPLQINRGQEKLPINIAEGMTSLNLPDGQLTTHIHYAPVVDRPPLIVKHIENEKPKENKLTGRMFNRTQAVWECRFEGPTGKYRLALPPKLKAVKGVQQQRNGQTVELRNCERLWFYGPPPQTPVELTPVP